MRVPLGDPGIQSDALVYSAQAWQSLRGKCAAALEAYHRQYPLRKGIPREELRSRLGLSQAATLRALERLAGEGMLQEEGAWVRQPDRHVALSPSQEKQVEAYIKALQAEPYTPPTDFPLDPELLNLLVEDGKVVKINETVVFAASAYKDMVEKIVAHTKERGKITVAEGRDLFDTSRKYILPLLEYLDQQRITRRVGDERVLR